MEVNKNPVNEIRMNIMYLNSGFVLVKPEHSGQCNPILLTFSSNSRLSLAFASTFSAASFAARNLLDRCWFILALGATPSMAI